MRHVYQFRRSGLFDKQQTIERNKKKSSKKREKKTNLNYKNNVLRTSFFLIRTKASDANSHHSFRNKKLKQLAR